MHVEVSAVIEVPATVPLEKWLLTGVKFTAVIAVFTIALLAKVVAFKAVAISLSVEPSPFVPAPEASTVVTAATASAVTVPIVTAVSASATETILALLSVGRVVVVLALETSAVVVSLESSALVSGGPIASTAL